MKKNLLLSGMALIPQILTNKESIKQWKLKLYATLVRFDTFCVLDSNDYPASHFAQQSYELIAGIGCKSGIKLETASQDAFLLLKDFQKDKNIFGYLAYDLKNAIEALESKKQDIKAFPDMLFFEPEILITIKNQEITIIGQKAEWFLEMWKQQEPLESTTPLPALNFTPNMDFEQYRTNFNKAIEEIKAGNIYEMNLCTEYHTAADFTASQLIKLHVKLLEKNQAPFCGLFSCDSYWILSASPERFLKKEGNRLLSQPIKGTIKRGNTSNEDALIQAELRNSEKEMAENVMIVDLVRNDLSRSSIPGSVCVEELFGIYAFKNVHHMISSISSLIKENVSWTEAIKNAFPMGSMTGAPKISAMQCIENLESSKRGVFSGALGYVSKNSDFDFNVLIRSLYYNEITQTLSYQAGGAITIDSEVQSEWDELQLKAESVSQLFHAVD